MQGVDRAAADYRTQQCDGVVAIGGGSVIDTAKLTAVLAAHPGQASDYVGHSDRVTAATAPLIVIPTTAGTGSEASPDAGIHPDAHTISSGITSRHVIPKSGDLRSRIRQCRCRLGSPQLPASMRYRTASKDIYPNPFVLLPMLWRWTAFGVCFAICLWRTETAATSTPACR